MSRAFPSENHVYTHRSATIVRAHSLCNPSAAQGELTHQCALIPPGTGEGTRQGQEEVRTWPGYKLAECGQRRHWRMLSNVLRILTGCQDLPRAL